jgi:AcrR family transcriptional regulator
MRTDVYHNRMQLVRAVRDVVGQRGSTDVGIREIAAAAGVGTATLYRHFSTKEMLIDEVSVVRWSRMDEYARHGVRTEYTPLQHVLGILEAFTRMTTADDGFITAAGLAVGRAPRAIHPIRQSFEPAFAELWVEAQREGQLRRGADPRDAVEMAGAIRDRTRRIQMMTMLTAGICTAAVDAESLVGEMFLKRSK